jgi:hypothetical protein
MVRLRFTILFSLLAACSGGDNPKDAGVDQSFADLPVVKKDLGKVDKSKTGDLNPSTIPTIKSISPDSGFADQETAVNIIGENFDQKTLAVYIDGQVYHGTVQVTPTSAQFTMPKNPYGPPYTPYTVTVQVISQNVMSNLVKFRYILAAKASSNFHGVITTTSLTDAITYIATKPIEGKVTFSNLDAGVAGNPDAEFGYGPVGTDPSNATTKGWHWTPATFDRTESGYSFYSIVMHFPTAGDFDMAYRFSVDGGQYWIFADTNDTDFAYSTAQAAKLTVKPPPYARYCLGTEDCAAYGGYPVCDTSNKICVECLAAGDCTGNTTAFGPNCDSKTKTCTCASNDDCASNPHGAVCNPPADPRATKYCGCTEDTNCTGIKTCKALVQDGATVCF